jgi:hypothetical protein
MNTIRGLLSLMSLAIITPAWATSPMPSPAPVMVVVADDSMLAAARGKYLGQFVVSGVMIEMATRWLTQEAIATASARLTATGLDHNGRPDVSAATTARVDTTAVTPRGSSINATGVQISGLGQISQIAGDGNSMSNITSIGFQREALPSPAVGATSSESSTGGYRAFASLAGTHVVVGVNAPNGAALQSIQSRGPGGTGNVMQTAQIVGNEQHVVNQMSVQLQIRSMSASQLSQIGIGQALEAVSMMRR